MIEMEGIRNILSNTKKGMVPLIAMCIILAAIMMVLEWYYPTYSGLSHWHLIHRLPIFAAISAAGLIGIELLAGAIGWGKNLSYLKAGTIGAVCAFISSGPLVDRMLGLIQISAPSVYVFWASILLLAAWLRYKYVQN